mmetsp:Transcript_79479/g.257420  ORF Transcript_79479/g.257420 Transcript_79479/m.257420 type:complete len:503 (-) Transcript_79479:237-1745(-)
MKSRVVLVPWALEEVQHALRHDEAADNVHGRRHGRQGREAVGHARGAAQQHHAAEGRGAGDGVRHGHQRRVQRVLHPPDHLVAGSARKRKGAKKVPGHRRAHAQEQGIAARHHERAVEVLPERAQLHLLGRGHGRGLRLRGRGLRRRRHRHLLAVLGADYGPGDDVALLARRQRAIDAGEKSFGFFLGTDVAQEVGQVLCVHGGTLAGHAPGQVGVAYDRHAVVGHHHLVLLRELAITPAHSGKVHDDAARLHVFDHILFNEHRAWPARNGGGGDHDLALLQVLVEGVLLRLLEGRAALFGVPALAGAALLEVHRDPGSPHGLHLVADVAHVPGAHHGAHGLGGADGRQARHAHAQDHGVGRRVLAGRRHLRREETAVDVGSLQDSPVPRAFGLRREHVQLLGDGDARHRGEVHQLHARLGGLRQQLLGVRQAAAHPRHGRLALQRAELGDGRRVDREDQLVVLDQITAACHGAANILVELVGEARLGSCAGLDIHSVTVLD